MALVCSNWAEAEPLSAAFRRMWEGDAVFEELWSGRTPWGYIDGITEDSAGYRKAETPSWADLSIAAEPVLLSGTVGQSPAAEKPLPPPHREVPPFTVGIKDTAPRAVPPAPPGRMTLILRNLPRDITVEGVRRVLDRYGPIRDIYIPRNMDQNSPYYGTIKGFALIKFLKPEDSAAAYQSEYGVLTIGKNNITVEFAAQDR